METVLSCTRKKAATSKLTWAAACFKSRGVEEHHLSTLDNVTLHGFFISSTEICGSGSVQLQGIIKLHKKNLNRCALLLKRLQGSCFCSTLASYQVSLSASRSSFFLRNKRKMEGKNYNCLFMERRSITANNAWQTMEEFRRNIVCLFLYDIIIFATHTSL